MTQTTDIFKIISHGRELSYPMLRLLSMIAVAFTAGLLVGSDVFKPLVTQAVNAMVCQ